MFCYIHFYAVFLLSISSLLASSKTREVRDIGFNQYTEQGEIAQISYARTGVDIALPTIG